MVAGPAAAFYCVADSRYFLGAAGMLNSLRRAGHREAVYVLDAGLTEPQRELLAPHVTLVDRAPSAPGWLLKTIAPLRHPAEVMVLIDADMIVTRSLEELIDRARSGHVVAFRTSYERYYERWAALLDLPPARRQPYVSSGFVACAEDPGRRVLEALDARRDHVAAIAFEGAGQPGDKDALFGLDQDVLNAVLASSLEPERTVALDYRLAPAPPFDGLRLVEPGGCAYADGVVPYLVHHHGRKPWLEPLAPSVYSVLLSEHLLGPQLSIRIPASWVAQRLRPGAAGAMLRAALAARERVRASLRRD